ncbi:MAG: NUDIX hydrolase [Candidatus Limnocylindrales bacterium]
MSDDHLRERTVERRVVHRGRFMAFRVDTIEDAGGKRHQREIVEHPGAVAVIPVVGADVLMVRQWRSPVEQVVLELPAGTLDRDEDGMTEDPDRAAPRELEEETGHRAGSWRKLGRFWTAPGFAEEEMHLYLATELSPLHEYRGPDTDEYLDLVRIPWREALAMADRGDIEDAKTLIGLFWLERLAAAGDLG